MSRLTFRAHTFSTAPTTLTMRRPYKARRRLIVEHSVDDSIFSLELHLHYKVVLAKNRDFLLSQPVSGFLVVAIDSI